MRQFKNKLGQPHGLCSDCRKEGYLLFSGGVMHPKTNEICRFAHIMGEKQEPKQPRLITILRLWSVGFAIIAGLAFAYIAFLVLFAIGIKGIFDLLFKVITLTLVVLAIIFVPVIFALFLAPHDWLRSKGIEV